MCNVQKLCFLLLAVFFSLPVQAKQIVDSCVLLKGEKVCFQEFANASSSYLTINILNKNRVYKLPDIGLMYISENKGSPPVISISPDGTAVILDGLYSPNSGSGNTVNSSNLSLILDLKNGNLYDAQGKLQSDKNQRTLANLNVTWVPSEPRTWEVDGYSEWAQRKRFKQYIKLP
jgi:hypothetical protein